MNSLRYSKEHEWVRLDGEIATVGITDFAQEQLGDVVFVELPDVGKHVQQHGGACVVESVKAASEVYAPVSGEIVDINSELEEEPELVNQSPTQNGWFIKIRVSDSSQVEAMMDEGDYNNFIAGQG
jgi:glycine cleavage system H protein